MVRERVELTVKKGLLRVVSGLVAMPMAAGCLAVAGISPAAAAPEPPVTQACPPEGPASLYTFTNVKRSSRPTDLYSAYITGPGTITYNKTVAANVAASTTATVSAEAGVVFAKASASLGVSVTAGRTWTDGFSYALEVPSGQRRRMRLYQESRSFLVSKKRWNASACTYVTAYSGASANAPRTERVDEWKLES